MTGTSFKQALYFMISIHTPVKSVTGKSATVIRSPNYFNPHTREECDWIPSGFHGMMSDFNPHTREECDGPIAADRPAITNFNPHTREECDDLASGSGYAGLEFQSTHP